MADSACIQQVRCCNSTGADADTEEEDIIEGIAKSTIFLSMDLMDGFYQFPMRERYIPFTAVSTLRGMFWKWLFMPQGLINAPVTFN